MFGRPRLYTSYRSESAMLPTWTQRVSMLILITLAVLLPFNLPVINQLPIIRFLGDPNWIRLLTQAVIFGTAALGLNILSGVAGQVSLGHAFFMGTGAYAAVILGGESSAKLWGLGLPIWIWLPGAGICAALVGILVAPAAVRVRGLYLGIVTVGLVFIGLHLSRMLPQISGGAEVGRTFPALQFRWWKSEDPVIDFTEDGKWFGVFNVSGTAKTYLFCLAVLAVATVVAKNINRSRTGRALQAIRDRDVAAEVMGIPERKYKTIAFAGSSFFAGVAGALFASFIGKMPPEQFDLILSVEFIAILLIGGAGMVSGTLMGTFFVVMTPLFVEEAAKWMSEQAAGSSPWGSFWNAIVSVGAEDKGLISTSSIAPGFALPVDKLDELIYGLLVIIFVLFEPLGLYGIWVRIRNYWKGWPFSY